MRRADCHPTRRYRAKGLCQACYALSLYYKNPEAKRAQVREYEAKNHEKVNASKKKYRGGHVAEATERARLWRLANLERARAAERRYREKNKGKANAATRRWAAANPDKIKDNALLRKYGLSFSQYTSMIETQAGRCAICGGAMSPPYVDHDHVTKKVRAALCQACNVGLGAFKDRPERLRNAALYVEHHRRPQTKGQAA